MNPTRSPKCFVPLALAWHHAGGAYRLTPWPEVRLERRYTGEWIPVPLSDDVAGAAVTTVEPAAWRAFLEFVPVDVREFLGCFRARRIAALQIAARCPDIVATLTETPALAAFVASHALLRGAAGARWDELNGVFERGGVFGVLEWLGLPATRPTLAILRNIVAADVPAHLLAPLRAMLWQPQGIFALAQRPAITDRDLAEACNALAA